MLKDMSKAVREANKKPGKSGLSYLEFKAHFLKQLSKAGTPLPANAGMTVGV